MGAKRVERSGFRPLEARSLKSICDTLRPYLAGRTVLDLFAGSGSFGLRMLEEGCANVVFIEEHKPLVDRLRASIEKPQFQGKATVKQADAIQFLKSGSGQFDLVFVDPPFALWEKDFFELVRGGVRRLLAPNGIALIRMPKRFEAQADGIESLETWKNVVLGESRVWYLYDRKT